MASVSMITAVLRLICIGAVVLSPVAVSAQEFPSKPIRLIVPFPPGGPNDLIARVVGQKLQEILKQQVVIDNRAGAGGALGTDVVAKAAPDGYTVAISSSGALAISISMQEKLPYDTLKHLKPITLVATVPELLVAATSLPAKDLKELIALARAKPGTLNYASSGPGGMPHLAGELLKVAAKIDIVHVPYKGAAPAVNDLLGQQVQMAFFDLPVLLPQVEAGKLRPIAVGSRERAPSLKNVPTTAELGYPQVVAENWYGMVAPIATPPAIVARLNQATIEALRDPGVKEKLSSQGLTLVGDTPDEFTAYIRTEIEKWAKVAKAAGLVAN
jgi:tripartite-type tricarboxylate transporter receptor subunit TctC